MDIYKGHFSNWNRPTPVNVVNKWIRDNFNDKYEAATFLAANSHGHSIFGCLSKNVVWELMIDKIEIINEFDFFPLIREFYECLSIGPYACRHRLMQIVERGYPVQELLKETYRLEKKASSVYEKDAYAELFWHLLDIRTRQNIINELYQIVPYMFEDGMLMSRKQRKI